jgi:hypothetical protein
MFYYTDIPWVEVKFDLILKKKDRFYIDGRKAMFIEHPTIRLTLKSPKVPNGFCHGQI